MKSLIKYSAIGFLVSLSMAIVACSDYESRTGGQPGLNPNTLSVNSHNQADFANDQLQFNVGLEDGQVIAFQGKFDIDLATSSQALFRSPVKKDMIVLVHKSAGPKGFMTYTVEVKESDDDASPQVYMFKTLPSLPSMLESVSVPDIAALAASSGQSEEEVLLDLIRWVDLNGVEGIENFQPTI